MRFAIMISKTMITIKAMCIIARVMPFGQHKEAPPCLTLQRGLEVQTGGKLKTISRTTGLAERDSVIFAATLPGGCGLSAASERSTRAAACPA
jgi:hypothetical protein